MTADRHAALPALMPRLVAFARTLMGDRETARDLVQEAAARALGAVRVPSEPAAYSAWMFRIVRNAAIDELRRRRVSRTTPEPPPADTWRFDDAWIARITVEQGLSALASDHREIIALIDIAGFSYAEAAATLSIPVGTVMSRLARARIALLAAIEATSLRPLRSYPKDSRNG